MTVEVHSSCSGGGEGSKKVEVAAVVTSGGNCGFGDNGDIDSVRG